MVNKNGYVYFHQGWADIINQLSLITYYSKLYTRITVIIREEAKNLIEFYLRGTSNITPLYIKHNGDIPESVLNDSNGDLLFHGFHDSLRRNFKKTCTNINPNEFWKNFYICYGIDYNVRVNDFTIQRDFELENKKYQEFVELHGNDYILYHEDVISDIVREIKFNKDNKECKYVSLTNATNTFFDYIKILQNAKEIQVVDSVWAAVLYHLDAKYNLFKNIPITVNCMRNHNGMFLEPIKLSNWIVN
jgi:hypothetical protein